MQNNAFKIDLEKRKVPTKTSLIFRPKENIRELPSIIEQLAINNPSLKEKSIYINFINKKNEIIKNAKSLKEKVKELSRLEEKVYKKISKIGDDNIIMGCIYNITHKFLCYLPDENIRLLIQGEEHEVVATEKLIRIHQKKAMSLKGEVYIGLNNFFQKIKPIILRIQEDLGKINEEKILEQVNETIFNEFSRISNYESKNPKKDSDIMYENCFDKHQIEFLIHIYFSTRVIEDKLAYAKLQLDKRTMENIQEFTNELSKFLDGEYRDFVKWKNTESKDGLIRTQILLENSEPTEEEFIKREEELKELTYIKLKNKIRGTKAKITRAKNAVPKFKTKQERVEYILKRNLEELNPSKKALKSLRRTLESSSIDLLDRELKTLEQFLREVKNV